MYRTSIDNKTKVIKCEVQEFSSLIDTFTEEKTNLITVSSAENDEGNITLQYFFKKKEEIVILEVTINKGDLVPSLYSKFMKSDFIEREIHRIFKIKFLGHPNLGKDIS